MFFDVCCTCVLVCIVIWFVYNHDAPLSCVDTSNCLYIQFICSYIHRSLLVNLHLVCMFVSLLPTKPFFSITTQPPHSTTPQIPKRSKMSISKKNLKTIRKKVFFLSRGAKKLTPTSRIDSALFLFTKLNCCFCGIDVLRWSRPDVGKL